MPSDAQLADLQQMLDDIEGADHKAMRAKLLSELQSLPTTKDVHNSYEWLAYQLTFHEKEQPPNLFHCHQQLQASPAQALRREGDLLCSIVLGSEATREGN